MELGGLHHVTAVTARASENVAFYTQVLGLRLVKKSVNQDDVSAYHLFYADKVGTPGTDVTFFDWPRVGSNQPGTGSITATALRIPSERIDWWVNRLSEFGVPHNGIEDRNGRKVIAFTDPEGQHLELVGSGSAVEDGAPWEKSTVPPDAFIRGLHGVTLAVNVLAPTAHVLTEILGFRQVDEYPLSENDSRLVTVFETGPGGSGTEVHVHELPQGAPAKLGAGGVHHVAFRTPNEDEHKEWRERIAAAGIPVTPVIDRYYFRSLYFREPGGILYEIATDGPGFATDEDVEHLGEKLALPPFLEPHRAEIEQGLKPITPTEVGRPS